MALPPRDMPPLSADALEMGAAEIERLRAELDAFRAAEAAVSQAYLRLRLLIPGAIKTPDAPTDKQVWDLAERQLTKLIAEHDLLLSMASALSAALNVVVDKSELADGGVPGKIKETMNEAERWLTIMGRAGKSPPPGAK